MSTTTGTVRGRIDGLGLTRVQLAVATGVVVAFLALAFFVQEPTVHDSLHNFRHVSGITCH